jgi:hypothetical protein
MSTEEKTKSLDSVDAPDFYWKFRLERLASKKGGDIIYSEASYPGVSGYKDLYDCYYLDLTVEGKLEGFDWEAEKLINDSEWLSVYKSIAQWSSKAAKELKPDLASLPNSDFDLLKQFYPSLNLKELESTFSPVEVGANFPYKNMKEMLAAANDGKLSVPGYSAASVSLDTTDAKKKVAALKESTMAKMEAVFQKSMAFATADFPDEESRTHYKALSATLGAMPQTPAEWTIYNAKKDAKIKSFIVLNKPADEHHGHEEEAADKEMPTMNGSTFDEMREQFAEYKADPVAFLEAGIIEQHGKEGLDVWKKSQEFSEKLATMSEADRTAVETQFSDFLNKA